MKLYEIFDRERNYGARFRDDELGREMSREEPLRTSGRENRFLRDQQIKRRRSGYRKMPGFRKYLNVPYREKDEAKAVGAKWDPNQKKWYIPIGPGQDWQAPEGFEHWME